MLYIETRRVVLHLGILNKYLTDSKLFLVKLNLRFEKSQILADKETE